MYLLRRWPVWQLAAVDSGVYVMLALCARWCLPPLMRGDSSNWLYIVTVGQLVAPAWFTPTTMLAVLALASGAAYWAGAAMTPPGSGLASPTSPATAVMLLLAVVSAAWCGRRMLYRKAVEADAALERADQDSVSSTSSCPGKPNAVSMSDCSTTPCSIRSPPWHGQRQRG